MKRAFTLIEILIVVILLAILAAIVLPRFNENSDETRSAGYQMEIEQLNSCTEKYYKDLGAYPPGNDFDTACQCLVEGEYIEVAPKSPAGVTYSYSIGVFSCNEAAPNKQDK